jgi:hypothetical protein
MRDLIRRILREQTLINEFARGSKSNTDEFIEKARQVHGDKYTYDNVDYNGAGAFVNITCPKHGDFSIRASHHLSGRGCRDCYLENHRFNTDEFIERAKKVHGDKYTYDKVDYKTNKQDVIITCPKHGDFPQLSGNHLQGAGCPKCFRESRRYNTDEFIEKARQVHGDKYTYDDVDYKDAHTLVNITCPKHGDFLQKPGNHLSGQGCPTCLESKGEKYVANILDNRNITYIRWKRFNDCRGFCRTLSFDFYLPDYNIFIEYDGRHHFKPVNIWGGDDSLKKQQMYDTIKNEYAKRNNIKLIRIPYTLPLKYVDDLLTTEIK